MGAINLKHTGGGSDVTLSSDGTSLLLDGTAVGGGADLYAAETTGSTDPTASGTLSLAIGSAASASGLRGVAIGRAATAQAQDSVAIGTDADTGTRSNSVAIKGNISGSGSDASVSILGSTTASGVVQIGKNGYVQANYATAIGYNADVESGGSNGVAIGKDAHVNGTSAIALGNSRADGASSFSAIIGNNTSSYGATGADGIAIGYLSKSHTGSRGTAIGYQANVGGNHASAYGHQANAGGAGANAVGYGSNASGNFGSAVGYAAKASGTDAVALGQSNASGDHSFSAVHADTGTTYGAQGDYSVAMGYHTKTTAQGAIAIGFESEATANYAVALGQSAAAGQHSFAAAINAVGSTSYGATGANSIAIGKQAKATQDKGVAIGSGAVVQGTGRYGGVAISANNLGTATVNNSGAVAIGESCTASANESIALGKGATTTGITAVALGDSRAGGQDSLAAAIANNSSSYGTTAQQTVALGYQVKATAGNSVAIGMLSQATASNGLAMIRGTASGQNSISIGNESIASATESVAIGRYAKADTKGKYAFSSSDTWGQGKAQKGVFVLKSDTTDATAETLTVNNSTASTDNQVILPNNSVYGFTGTVIAREDSASTNDFAVWEVKGGAVRGATASTTALGSYNINLISKSTGAANWDIALSADTTNGAVAITVTGEASHNIRWVATINTTEVIY